MTIGCTRNGFGRRLSQFKNGVTTFNAGLTQMLQDGANTYLYGVNRIAQVAETQTGYFLPDALGSVRQMTDAYGDITLTQSYTPYGEILYSEGTAATDYAFTGESYDPQTGLVYLRARYYASGDGRFISRDTWLGNEQRPGTLNSYNYGVNNPVLYVDPSGNFCLAGFDVTSWGAKCTDQDRQKAADTIRWFSGFVTSPSFAEGYLYEVVDSLTLASPEIARWALNTIISRNSLLRNTINLATLYSELSCNNLSLSLFLQFLKNGVQGDEYFQYGRAVGRVHMIILAASEITISAGGAVVTAAASPFTASLSLAGTAVSVSIGAYGAVVLGGIIIREANDKILTNFIRGNGGGSTPQGPFSANGIRTTDHFLQRLREWGISEDEAYSIYINGKHYTDNEGGWVIWDAKTKMAMAVDKDDLGAITIFEQPQVPRSWVNGWISGSE